MAIKRVPIRKGKKYINAEPTEMASLKAMPAILKRMYSADGKLRKPSAPIPVQKIDSRLLDAKPSDEMVLYWLGHTSYLLEMNGRRYLLDPVLTDRASMFSWVGPKRMHPSPIAVGDIHNIDAVILSHDHYDHLDYNTVTTLFNKEVLFYAPAGVGDILIKWGCPKHKVVQLNWWESIMDGGNTLTAVPARHFSGRGIVNRDTTLWCSWVIANDGQRLYFGGDSGIMPDYEDIGELYGPFDLTLLAIGAYDRQWHDIHTFPDEAVEAHIMLKGKKLMPGHWATFNLALHPWAEPIEDALVASKEKHVDIITPLVGERITLNAEYKKRWWRNGQD